MFSTNTMNQYASKNLGIKDSTKPQMKGATKETSQKQNDPNETDTDSETKWEIVEDVDKSSIFKTVNNVRSLFHADKKQIFMDETY